MSGRALTPPQRQALRQLSRAYGDPVDGKGRKVTFQSLTRRKLAVELGDDLYRVSLRGLLVVRGELLP